METTTNGWFICLSIFAFICCSPYASESQTYTILTPENPFCPSNSTCFTLAQFASTVYRLPSEIVSLNFLPGNHTLNVKVVMNNFQNFSLYALESASNGAVINCSPSAGLLFIRCDHVEVSNLTFNGCAGNIIESVNNFTIMFSSFVGENQFGSALIINSTNHLQIAYCHFALDSGFTNNSLSMLGKQKGVINATLCKAAVIMNSFFIKNAQTVLIFAHRMTNIAITNSLFKKNSVDAIILAESNSSISLYNSTFTRNSCFRALQIINSMLQVVSTGFTHSESVGTGGAIYALKSSVLINRSTIKHFNGSHNGGVMACFDGKISIHTTVFEYNVAGDQGGVLYANSTDVIIKESVFRFNHALVGGVLSLHWGRVSVNGSEFISNGASECSRGGVMVTNETVVDIFNSQFENNSAKSGGVMECYRCNMILSNIGFYSNMAEYKGIVYIYKSRKFTGLNLTFKNNAGKQGVLYIAGSTNIIFITLSYSLNTGSIVALGSRLSFRKYCVFYKNKPDYLTETLVFHNQGGAITSFQSTIVFHDLSDFIFINNYARFGGAIYAVKCSIEFFGNMFLSENKALVDGGGIYLYQTEIRSNCNLTLKRNIANNSGGGIYMVSDAFNINLETYVTRASIRILENSASRGGGIFLSNHAKLNIFGGKPLGEDNELFRLINNHADYGGALYVADDTNTGICNGLSDNFYATISNSVCFFRNLVFNYHTVSYNKSTFDKQGVFHFQNNTARYAGNNLFGGLLDRCFFGNKGIEKHPDSYFDYLNRGSIDFDSISSLPVKVCLCVDNQPDCNQQPSLKYVKKGELFNTSVVAVDQVNHTVNATIHCTLSSPEAGLGEGQLSQLSFKECTFLKFQLYSPLREENLTLYADGPCKDARLSRLSIPVIFSPCTCPIGFQPLKSKETSCVCECDYRLTRHGSSCNISSQSTIRENSYWINHVSMNENLSGFIYYAHCPYDYCHPPSFKINIDFNTPDGADAQCAFNRTGVLCGACKPGLSLSLGSSRCLTCPRTWPVSMTFVLIGSVFAGILLVALILMFDLTVAAGTINGFIFYANIIGANRRTYLPFVKPNFCTIFISWFNLDFGLDLCFFEGMDAYAKTWLQLSFPVFLFLIVGAIIFISNRSSRFFRLIGKKNPVATLATLILLAFTKFLHTIIAIFSFAVMKYPNNTSNVLWLLDASVKYLKGKHIALFFVATVIFIANFFFVLLLLSWQLILHALILKLSKSTRIHFFVDCYFAPYTPKFRFWTGLLLLARVIIYIVSTFNNIIFDDPAIDLIAVGIVIACLILLKVLLRGKIYQKLLTELLETACHFNILLFTIISFLSLESLWHQRVFAQFSVGIMFAMFVVVFLYHAFCFLKQFSFFSRLIAFIVIKVKKEHENMSNTLESQNVHSNPLATSSVIDMDSCILCNNNETHEVSQQKKERVNKDNMTH